MLPFGVTIPATVPQGSEIPEGLMNNPVYNKPTRCNSGGVVFVKNYKYALHVSDALCVHLQEHYKL